LMVVKATGQFGLLQVRSNVFVWHFLETGLEKIYLLQYSIRKVHEFSGRLPYLIFAPCSTSSGRRGLPILLNTKLMPTDGIDRGVVGRSHMGRSVHLVHW
jgi:hypothetical protein